MIVSQRPPYDLTSAMLRLVTTISEKIGRANAYLLMKPEPQLRRRNQIKTIHASLRIEGNTLTEEQVTALINNKRVIGPPEDIQEVLNAIQVYDRLDEFRPASYVSFLKAHKIMMQDLIPQVGKYRAQNVGIFQGSRVAHVAPPADNVPSLMNNLFRYLRNADDLVLIKSCVFHYETEFIHPFMDGNGRMGRLWQTVILRNEHSVFDFLPFETLISNRQQEYYEALAGSDKAGKSNVFIEYMLDVINESLAELLQFNSKTWTADDRLNYFLSLHYEEFSRKGYMDVFKNISPATASRDLQRGVEQRILERYGDKRKAVYRPVK